MLGKEKSELGKQLAARLQKPKEIVNFLDF